NSWGGPDGSFASGATCGGPVRSLFVFRRSRASSASGMPGPQTDTRRVQARLHSAARAVAPQHFVNALVPRRIAGGVELRAGGDQRLDDGKVVSPGLVDGGPHGRAQDRAAVHALYFERHF